MSLNNLDQLTEFLHLSHEDLKKLEDLVRQAVRAEMQDLKDKIAKFEEELEMVTLENNYLRSNSSPEVLASLPSIDQLPGPTQQRLRSLKEKAADPGVQPWAILHLPILGEVYIHLEFKNKDRKYILSFLFQH